MTQESPLSTEALGSIDDALAAIKFGKEQIRMAIQAGIDVSNVEPRFKLAEERLLKIKQTYFPESRQE